MPAPATFLEGVEAGVYNQLYNSAGGNNRGGTNAQGRWETMSFEIPWAYRSEFQDSLLNPSEASGGDDTTDPAWVKSTPFKHPDYPNLYAGTIDWEPLGELPGTGFPTTYQKAIAHVNFNPPSFNFQAEDDPGGKNSFGETEDEHNALIWVTQETDFGAEWITVPNTSVKFSSDNKIIDTPLRRRMTVIQMTLTWHKLPYMPIRRLRTFADKINLTTFLGCDPFTVMFTGVKVIRDASVNGKITQKVQMGFKWRTKSWNRQLRGDTLTYDLVADSLGNLLYEAVDFRPILF